VSERTEPQRCASRRQSCLRFLTRRLGATDPVGVPLPSSHSDVPIFETSSLLQETLSVGRAGGNRHVETMRAALPSGATTRQRPERSGGSRVPRWPQPDRRECRC
jgi:hypothetical protein